MLTLRVVLVVARREPPACKQNASKSLHSRMLLVCNKLINNMRMPRNDDRVSEHHIAVLGPSGPVACSVVRIPPHSRQARTLTNFLLLGLPT